MAAISLYKICLTFVGKHTELLDSLVNFPDTIGQDIFKSSEGNGKLSAKTFKNFQVFFEAYNQNGILDSLSLCNDPLFFNETIDECLWLYCGLTHLDLSSCGLGDTHDAFPLILSQMARLQTLLLCDNSLSDEAVRRLTARARMYSENSFAPLQVLDLSCNAGISTKSLAFLSCLKTLSVIGLSSSRQEKDEIKRRFKDWQPLEEKVACECVKSRFRVTTGGWAKEAVEKWKSEVSLKRLSSPKCQSSSSTLLSSSHFERPAAFSRCPVNFRTHESSSELPTTISSSTNSFYSRKRVRQEVYTEYQNIHGKRSKKEIRLKNYILVSSTGRFSCRHFDSKFSITSNENTENSGRTPVGQKHMNITFENSRHRPHSPDRNVLADEKLKESRSFICDTMLFGEEEKKFRHFDNAQHKQREDLCTKKSKLSLPPLKTNVLSPMMKLLDEYL